MTGETMKKNNTGFVLTGAITISIHLMNRLCNFLATKNNLLQHVYDSYYDWRFGQIRYTKTGSGRPILLIHNLTTGSSMYEFHLLEKELSKNYEVYSIDLLGYGLSDKANITYTNFLYVQLITDFIKNVIGKKTTIITSGDASSIGIMTTHNDSEIINHLIMIHPQNLYVQNQIPSKQTKLLKLIIDIPIFGTFVYNIFSSKEYLRKQFDKEYFYNPDNCTEGYIQAYSEASHIGGHNAKYTFSSYIGKYMNTNVLHALKEINNSITILSGKCKPDIETMIENYQYYNSSIESLTIDNAKSLPHLENTEETVRVIDTILNHSL